MLNQTTVVNTAKRLITFDSTIDADFDTIYDDSISLVKHILGSKFAEYYNAPATVSYTAVEEYDDESSLFTFSRKKYLKEDYQVIVNGTEYSDVYANVLQAYKDDTEYKAVLDIVFTATDTGSVSLQWLDNYYKAHANILIYLMMQRLQKLYEKDVLVTSKEFGEGFLNVNSQTEITAFKSYLWDRALFLFGQSIKIEVI